ncbi:MAG TPA: LpxD N-terminal domain-containing protein, partial [Deltaproteobacteria bacterium]|nr:LpxD N-terminal domain-containing protein [Deltaproteobacteria bacterium]
MRLSRITELLGGSLAGEDREITGASTLEEATPSDISFFANRKYREAALRTRAGALVTSEPLDAPCSQIVTDNPYLYFARVLGLLHPEPQRPRG